VEEVDGFIRKVTVEQMSYGQGLAGTQYVRLPIRIDRTDRLNSESAIDINHVSKYFPLYMSRKDRLTSLMFGHRWRKREQFCAVSNVSLKIRKGETVGLLGVNGAGKSTLLQMIAGTLTPSAGTVVVDGTVAALLELGSGFNPLWTGRENALFQCRMNGMSEAEIPQRLEAIEAFADVGSFFDQPMRIYSSGMYMRVAFASAITVDPDILIIDEALAVGDARFQNKCFNRFFEMQKAGKTIIFVTHSAELVAAHCSRGVVMDGGQIIFDGTSKEAVNVYLRKLYGSEPIEGAARAGAKEEGGAVSGTVQVPADFLSTPSEEDVAHRRWGYDPKEFRFGDQTARITDFEIYRGDSAARQFNESDVMRIIMRVHFLEDKPAPFYGLVLKTVDGVRLYGTTNDMQGDRKGPVKAGQTVFVSITCPLPLIGGAVFIEIGVGSMVDGEVVVHDTRGGITNITIVWSPHFNGYANLKAGFDLLT
jgi:lipopolysaccharide transport system ATP-binding protein